jgi:predicted Zn-dependent protease
MSRDHELESDRLGFEYMKKAGYDPENCLTIGTKIFSDGSTHKIWRTHPMGKDRLAQLEQLMAASKPQNSPESASKAKVEEASAKSAETASSVTEPTPVSPVDTLKPADAAKPAPPAAPPVKPPDVKEATPAYLKKYL